jgi:EAL and modified HD-GYP domain-containing signal transduction protein
MFTYIARQAILNKNKGLYAYELLFRDGENNYFPNIPPDEATSKILTDSHLELGLEGISVGKPVFINFHQDTLLHRFPTSLAPKWDVLLPYTDINKVDIVECDEQVLIDNIDKYLGSKIKLIAEKIETLQEFEKYRDMGFDYFQGYFFAKQEVIRQKNCLS